MSQDIIVIGSLNIDLIITGSLPADLSQLEQWVGQAEMQICTAGAIGYIAQDLQLLGASTGVISCLADDTLGEHILRDLKRNGVHTDFIRIEIGKINGIAVYLLMLGNRKRPLIFRPATTTPWPRKFSNEDLNYISSARILYNGGYLHFNDMWNGEIERLFKHARENGVITAFDPQFPIGISEFSWSQVLSGILKYTDILFMDEHEAMRFANTDDIFRAGNIALSYGPKLIVIKKGKKGAVIITNKETLSQPAELVDSIVDSIGAGDAFNAGFIIGVLENWPYEKALRFASKVAASSLKGSGGTSSLAPRKTIEDTL